jgi:hypothetical protein
MDESNPPLNDEITSINSIYGDDTLHQVSQEPAIWTLRLPTAASITLRLAFPTDYPDAPPSVLGTESVGGDVPKGAGKSVVHLARNVLSKVYRPGEACVFDLIEEVGEALRQSAGDEDSQQGEDNTKTEHLASDIDSLASEPPWILAPAVTEKKSVFLARVASVSSPDQAKKYLQHLLATDKKAARASHNMVAWRIRGPDGIAFQDYDEDGETAAGGRMLHLMQLMDVWDVMVVVTRWYGGVLLGPDRFRIINSVARDALAAAGYVKDGGKKGKRGGGG